MNSDPNLARLRADIARRARVVARHPADEAAKDELRDARGRYAEARIAECVARVVATAPPLSAAQRDRLVVLLRPEETPSGVAERATHV